MNQQGSCHLAPDKVSEQMICVQNVVIKFKKINVICRNLRTLD